MSSSLDFHKRGWSSQRIAQGKGVYRRETETKPKPVKLAQIKSRGACPYCGQFFIRGLHLHVLKKHKAK